MNLQLEADGLCFHRIDSHGFMLGPILQMATAALSLDGMASIRETVHVLLTRHQYVLTLNDLATFGLPRCCATLACCRSFANLASQACSTSRPGVDKASVQPQP